MRLLELCAAMLIFCYAGAAVGGISCSRARSRTARRILEEYLYPFVEDAGYTIPTSCRLHPSNDMFKEQELNKEFVHLTQWRCGYCEKVFESEDYLDLHFDNRHGEMVNATDHNCLADVCGALHCDYVETKHKRTFSKDKCSQHVDRNRLQCESLANSCFPPKESPTAARLYDFFLRQFCDAHSCKKRSYFPRGKRSGNQAVYYAACFFTVLIVILIYIGLYLYRKETNLSFSKIKRLSQRPGFKRSKKH